MSGSRLRDGVTLPEELTALEYRLLEYFCRHAGEDVCKRADLEDYLWPDDYGKGDTDRLTALVKRLRHKLRKARRGATFKRYMAVATNFSSHRCNGSVDRAANFLTIVSCTSAKKDDILRS